MRRSILLLLTLAICAAAPAAAGAATPFTAGTGGEPSVTIGPDGTGHVVWTTTEDNARVGYCRISPGASACNAVRMLNFGPATDAHLAGRAMVFTPADETVYIVAGCWECGGGGTTDRTFVWHSPDGGTTFTTGNEFGYGIQTEGFGTWLTEIGTFLGASGTRVKATAFSSDVVQFAPVGFGFGADVARVPGGNKLVAVSNNLEEVAYGVYGGPLVAESINKAANWTTNLTLPAPDGDNSETVLNSGPSGLFLSYAYFVANDTRVGLRRFDPTTDSFGAPTYIEGSDAIDNISLDEPDTAQDPAGRIHAVWRTLYDNNRLRYTVSDTAGANFSTVATLARGEDFNEPEVAAGADGHGFAVWVDGFTGPIRVVPLAPEAESAPPKPAPAPPKDTAKPSVSGFGIDDTTLLPGQKARFSFNANEAGSAVLTVEQRFAGLKGKAKGKRVCLPKTKKRLAALRRQADDAKALAKLLKQRRCTGYKRVGEIRQAATAGRNTIEFDGRIAGRKLKPGAYRALLVVSDGAGNVSRTETVSFKVVGKKAKPKKRAAK